MFVLQVSFRNHDSHKLYYDLYQGDGRVIDMEIIFYSTELNHNVNFWRGIFLGIHNIIISCQEDSFIRELQYRFYTFAI